MDGLLEILLHRLYIEICRLQSLEFVFDILFVALQTIFDALDSRNLHLLRRSGDPLKPLVLQFLALFQQPVDLAADLLPECRDLVDFFPEGLPLRFQCVGILDDHGLEVLENLTLQCFAALDGLDQLLFEGAQRLRVALLQRLAAGVGFGQQLVQGGDVLVEQSAALGSGIHLELLEAFLQPCQDLALHLLGPGLQPGHIDAEILDLLLRVLEVGGHLTHPLLRCPADLVPQGLQALEILLAELLRHVGDVLLDLLQLLRSICYAFSHFVDEQGLRLDPLQVLLHARGHADQFLQSVIVTVDLRAYLLDPLCPFFQPVLHVPHALENLFARLHVHLQLDRQVLHLRGLLLDGSGQLILHLVGKALHFFQGSVVSVDLPVDNEDYQYNDD